MSNDATRRTEFERYFEKTFGCDRQKFMDATGISKGRVTQYLDETEPFGEKAALNLERRLGLEPGAIFPSLQRGSGLTPTAKARDGVPVVGTAKLGEDGYYEEISSIPGAGDGHIEIALDDPNAYGLRVRGQSMFPAIRDGWFVLVKPNSTPREGEFVLLKLRDGRKMVKEFLFRRADSVEVMSVNGGERLTFELADLEGMHAVGAVVSPSQWRPD